MLMTEMMAYFYLFSYSYVMKKKITSLTSSVNRIILMAHSLSILIPLMIYLPFAIVKERFGQSVSLNFINECLDITYMWNRISLKSWRWACWILLSRPNTVFITYSNPFSSVFHDVYAKASAKAYQIKCKIN